MNRKPASNEGGGGGGTPTRIRILVIGDEGVGKNMMVDALCGNFERLDEDFVPAIRVSVRKCKDVIEEYYVMSGNSRYINGRGAIARLGYEGIIFLHSDEISRKSIQRNWVPWIMYYLGDGKSITSAGRRDTHIRSIGCINELGVLWRRIRTQYGINFWSFTSESFRLCLRWLRLILHESTIWCDNSLDISIEHELLAAAEVPVAIVKWVFDEDDLDERKIRVAPPFAREGKDVFVVDTAINDVLINKQFSAFRARCVELVRNGRTPTHRRRRSGTASMSIPLLPF